MAPGSFLQHAQALTAAALLGLLVLFATTVVHVDGHRHIQTPDPEDAHPPVELIFAPDPAPPVEAGADTEVVTLPPDVYKALPGRKGRVPYPIHHSPPPPHKWGSSSSNEEAAAVVTHEAQPGIGGDFPLPGHGRPPYNLKKSPPPPSPPKHKGDSYSSSKFDFHLPTPIIIPIPFPPKDTVTKHDGEGDSKFQLPVPIIIPIPFPPEDTDKEAHAQPKEEALGEGDSKFQPAAVPAHNIIIPIPYPPNAEDMEAQQEGEALVSADDSEVYPIPGHPPHRRIPRSPAPAPGHEGGPYVQD